MQKYRATALHYEKEYKVGRPSSSLEQYKGCLCPNFGFYVKCGHVHTYLSILSLQTS